MSSSLFLAINRLLLRPRGGGGGRSDPGRREVVRRYHAHTPGLLYVGFTLLLAVGAVNSQNNLLFLALGLSIGALLVSGVVSGASLLSVRVERRVPGRVEFGKPVRAAYTITNSNRVVPAFGLHVVECGGVEGAELQTFVVHVPPRGSAQAEIILTPRRRGRINLLGVRIWSTFPFGLTKKSVTFDAARTVLVLPPDVGLRPGVMAKLTARGGEGAGAENTTGGGDEFFGLREYIAGDNPRRIAWKRSARTGQFVVRQHAAPAPPRLSVVLDFGAGRSAGGNGSVSQGALDERAIALAAAVLRRASAEGMAVGLTVPGARQVHPPREGRAALDRLLTELALLEPARLRQGGDDVHRGAAGASSSARVVISASPDGGGRVRGTHHISAVDAHEYFAADEESSAVLALVDATSGDDGKPRGGRRRGAALRSGGAVAGRGVRGKGVE